MSKKLQEKQQRRLAEERRKKEQHRAARRRNLVTGGIALAVAAIVVALILNETSKQEAASSAPIGVAAEAAGCSPDEKFDKQGEEHVEVGTDVTYETNPPTSGDHWPPDAISDPGFFTTQSGHEDERLVHNMEHGQIIIWYQPDAPQEIIDDIEEYVSRDEDFALIAVPHAFSEDDATYAVTAWTHMQTCEEFSSEVVDEFRAAHQGIEGNEPQLTPRFTG